MVSKSYIQILRALSVFILLAATGCSEDTIDPEFTGDLTGTVTSEDTDEPLANVKITTSPSTTTVFSTADGSFRLLNLPEDSYSVMAELDGFDTAFEGVEIQRDEESVVIFELETAQLGADSPSAPMLIAPEDGADDLETEVDFVWSQSISTASQLTYDVEIRNALTSEVLNFEVVQDTTLTVTDLDLGANYIWQVTVSDGDNSEVSSLVREFSTLSFPSNPFLFVKKENGNGVIFSGGGEDDDGGAADENLFQLTDDATNSFRPRKNEQVAKIAFLRSSGGLTHIYLMDLTGQNVEQLTNTIPVAGFRQDELDFSWSPDGSYILYPSFDKLYRVNLDGSGETIVYSTPDGALISEVDIKTIDDNILLLKTNDINGYDARIFTLDLENGSEIDVILEDVDGAVGSAQISVSGDRVLYTRDMSGFEDPNGSYRIFQSRIFIWEEEDGSFFQVNTSAVVGKNDLDAQFSPTEAGVIFTRVDNDLGAIPSIYRAQIDSNGPDDDQLFTAASMPDWE